MPPTFTKRQQNEKDHEYQIENINIDEAGRSIEAGLVQMDRKRNQGPRFASRRQCADEA